MKEIPITSFDNLQIGQAENAAAGTGCTVVLLGKDGAPAGLDVRGGGPASRESELLKPLAAAQVIHAIVLAGGSAFGLNAAGGVMRYLEERGIGFDVGVTKVPLVCQSDLFDLTVADARARPDAAMALRGLRQRRNRQLPRWQPRRGHRYDCRQAAGHGPLHEIRNRQLRRAGGRPEGRRARRGQRGGRRLRF